jgi:hypothetical protein
MHTKSSEYKGLDEIITSISTDGYYVFKSAFSSKVAEKIRDEIRLVKESEINPSKGVPFLNSNSDIVYNPDHKSMVILHFLLRGFPLLHTVLKELLNDVWYRNIPNNYPNYILRAAIARSSSIEPLPMHIDSFIPSSSKHINVMQALYCLESSTAETGSTIIVPGSHISDQYAPATPSCVTAIELEPGDIALWDSRLWHGALPNKSNKTRWALVATYTRWWIKQNYQKPKSMPAHFKETLTRQELTIIGHDSFPPFDEYDRVDIKGGYR